MQDRLKSLGKIFLWCCIALMVGYGVGKILQLQVFSAIQPFTNMITISIYLAILGVYLLRNSPMFGRFKTAFIGAYADSIIPIFIGFYVAFESVLGEKVLDAIKPLTESVPGGRFLAAGTIYLVVWKASEKALKAIQAKYPRFSFTQLGKEHSFALRAAAMIENQQYTVLGFECEKRLRNKPDQTAFFYLGELAWYGLGRDQDIDQAIKYYTAALELDGDFNAKTHWNLANIYIQMRDHAALTVKHLEQAFNLGHDPAGFLLADIKIRHGTQEEIKKEGTEVLERLYKRVESEEALLRHPDLPELLTTEAKICHSLGWRLANQENPDQDLERSETVLRKAISLGAEDARPLLAGVVEKLRPDSSEIVEILEAGVSNDDSESGRMLCYLLEQRHDGEELETLIAPVMNRFVKSRRGWAVLRLPNFCFDRNLVEKYPDLTFFWSRVAYSGSDNMSDTETARYRHIESYAADFLSPERQLELVGQAKTWLDTDTELEPALLLKTEAA